MTSFKLITTLLTLLFLVIAQPSFAGKKKVKISVSETDAKITVDGRLMGQGQLDIVVGSDACVTVQIAKVGYVSITRTYCNKKNMAAPPKTDFIQLEIDESYSASVSSDVANVDLALPVGEGLKEEEAWKRMSMIITGYFDVIEVTDLESGYMRTSWEVQSFKTATIRTRLVIKLGAQNPLAYRVKIMSEIAPNAGVSVKNDELFSEWDRILRKYESLISELQSRLKK